MATQGHEFSTLALHVRRVASDGQVPPRRNKTINPFAVIIIKRKLVTQNKRRTREEQEKNKSSIQGETVSAKQTLPVFW